MLVLFSVLHIRLALFLQLWESISSAGVVLPCAHQTCVVSAALGEVRHGLRDALMLELSPGEAFYQESTVVLLRGKLLMTGRADTVPLQQLPGQLLALVTLLMPTAAQLHRQTEH